MKISGSVLGVLPLAASLAGQGTPDGQSTPAPRELGAVAFSRDLDATLKSQPEKPIWLLFQEVPGWKTCVDFGQQVLSHPLLVEAIQGSFVPVAIFNNKKGRDLEILRRYKEPTWNNPVVRFVDASGKDLIARRDGVYSVSGIAARMAASLRAVRREVPGYLELLARPPQKRFLQKATFAMYWYWEGEVALGALPGVVNTRAGWLEGKEVVEVIFDPRLTPYAELLEKSRCVAKPSTVYVHDAKHLAAAKKAAGADVVSRSKGQKWKDAKASDRRYYLRKSPFWYLPLTELQAVRLNALLAAGAAKKDPVSALGAVLSPKQRALAVVLAAGFKVAKPELARLQPARKVAGFAGYEAKLRRVLGRSREIEKR